MKQRLRWEVVSGVGGIYAPIAILFVAFALRMYNLDAQPIWWDEAMSIHLARSSIAEIVINRAGNLHPPLYFFLLKGWVTLAGDSALGVRFLSVWFGMLLMPALYTFGRRWLNRRAGLIAAVFATLSPLYVAYAQEARVYALLPLIYLALLALLRSLGRSISRPRWRDWLALALVEVLALGLHYMSLFAVAYVLAALLIRLRRPADRGRLLAVQGLVLLLLLPWLLTVLHNADAFTFRLGMSNWRAEPVTVAHYLRLLWTFQLTGLASLIADPAAIGLTAAVALALAAASVYLLVLRGSRPPTAGLLLDWLAPLVSAFAVWLIRPLSHPRYVILFTPALLLLSSFALDRLPRRSVLGQALAAFLALVLAAALSFGLFLVHSPRFAKDDTQGVATAIAARSTAGDLVLVPPEDWSVPYYHDGPAQVEMVWPGDAPADWGRLAALTEEAGAVFLVDYYRATRDPRGLLPFALESAGSLIDRWGFKGLYVRVYELDRPTASPELAPTDACFGLLRLSGAWVEHSTPADTAVAVALRWRLEAPADAPLRASLRLQDSDGWAWASTDDWLLDGSALPTTRWAVGQEATSYHLLPLPPGTPPLSATLAVGVYREEGEVAESLDLLDGSGSPQGQSFDVSTISLGPPLGLETDPYRLADRVPLWETPAELSDGIVLTGASLDREMVAPGQPLFVTLRWRAEIQPGRQLTASLVLEQEGTGILSEPAAIGGHYPADRWAAGQDVVEHRRLVIPPAAADGPAVVALQVDGQRVELGQVEIVAGEHLFAPPPMAHGLDVRFGDVAELLGYDLEREEVVWDEPVVITLYWRALGAAGRADYAVFTHILADDGRLVGQHDGPPAAGARPTLGWIPGEVIVDRHEMTFREPYAGPARVEVGLYDTATLERVQTESGDTFVLLPMGLTVLKR